MVRHLSLPLVKENLITDILTNPDIKNHKGLLHCESADYEDEYFV